MPDRRPPSDPDAPQGRTLVIGYGNPDRQDDGVASHVLQRLSERLAAPLLSSAADLPHDTGPADLLLQLQLTPEMVEAFSDYAQVIFVDAHTGDDQPEIHVKEVRPTYQTSPLTHHMTPETCMALLHGLYHRQARGMLVSIRGHEFGFTHNLSSRTYQSVNPAVEMISSLITDSSPSTR